MPATPLNLDRLLRPRSVAIVGASEKPGALGNAVLRNLERHGYAGTIHLINPKRPVIAGRQALGGIDELPEFPQRAIGCPQRTSSPSATSTLPCLRCPSST